jgi:hypothetical protein
MKKIISLICTLCFISGYAQNKDYTKMKEKELIEELISRDKKIKELETKNAELTKNNKSAELNKQNAELIDIITNSNEVYLYEIFQNRYINDKNYFNEVDFDDKTTSKIKNSSILVNSIKTGKNCTSEDKLMAEKVLNLRTNYLKFIELDKEYQSVINEKYNEPNTINLVSKLDVLQFDVDSKLDKRKQEYIGVLKNYSKYTCELNKDIAKLLKNPKQDNPLVKSAYDNLKKNSAYKNYPYFIKILDKVKNNYITYVENEDLPCIEKVEQKPIETVNEVQKTIEEKKE